MSELPRLAVPIKQAVEVSGRPRTRIFDALRSGELKGKKDGRATLIELDELRRWIKAMPDRAARPQRHRRQAAK